jgi:CDP-glycerol glycerophosphotransferase (TagB/SpsB family)
MIFSQLVDGDRILSVDNASFPEIEVLYRESVCLITDFSSAFIDYLLTDKPMLGYSQDQSNYLLAERGSYYQYEEVFPGKLTNRFEDLVNFINELDSGIDLLDTNKHKSAVKTFYKFAPGLNASRLVELIKKSVLSKI